MWYICQAWVVQANISEKNNLKWKKYKPITSLPSSSCTPHRLCRSATSTQGHWSTPGGRKSTRSLSRSGTSPQSRTSLFSVWILPSSIPQLPTSSTISAAISPISHDSGLWGLMSPCWSLKISCSGPDSSEWTGCFSPSWPIALRKV